ncbi:MAG: cysteine-rich CWC family protein [Chitinophagaceae bacterium]|nr:cysteine-rich CWC family protein [Chitinophagaceae bacterium]
MHNPQNKICMRCGKTFECNANNIKLCQCNSISLTEAERTYLQNKYANCLCIDCLKAEQSFFQKNYSNNP